MPVALSAPNVEDLHAVTGIKLMHAQAHIRKPNRKDILVIELAAGSSVAGVFTQNLFCAAPVQLCKQHLNLNLNLNLDLKQHAGNAIRALVINTGNANAGTGKEGLAHAQLTCDYVADSLGIQANQVLPFSTGVILEPLPIDRVLAGIEQAMQAPTASNWLDAAEAIMTTDTVAKAHSVQYHNSQGECITITGIAKGAGMIRPNMATMLGFITSNAHIDAATLQTLTKKIADATFNNITIDGDTSTNDSFIVACTNQSTTINVMLDVDDGKKHTADYLAFEAALMQVAQTLAHQIVRDGEGATKFIHIDVTQAHSETDAKKIAYAIAHSPLVKTAFYACDPNLGRILAAIGYSGVAIDIERLDMWINQVHVIHQGARHVDYQEMDGQAAMKHSEIHIKISLNQGQASGQVWTCDLSHDYVSINADYRS